MSAVACFLGNVVGRVKGIGVIVNFSCVCIMVHCRNHHDSHEFAIRSIAASRPSFFSFDGNPH